MALSSLPNKHDEVGVTETANSNNKINNYYFYLFELYRNKNHDWTYDI